MQTMTTAMMEIIMDDAGDAAAVADAADDDDEKPLSPNGMQAVGSPELDLPLPD